MIVVTQKNPAGLIAAHGVTNPVVHPPVNTSPDKSFRFLEGALSADIHEFLFEVKKAGAVFWVGAAVSTTPSDFTRAQVYFHPEVIQAGQVVAHDRDYGEFKGGWSGLAKRYIANRGGQLAGAGKRYPIIFPFTTMAALKRGAINVFSTDPVETLQKIVDAVRGATIGTGDSSVLERVGVSSYSSGIKALRIFLGDMKSSGLVKEIIDFDGPFITGQPKTLTSLTGATSRCFTQVDIWHPPPGWVTVKPPHFQRVGASRLDGLHRSIGKLMYHQAMLTSTL